jgi:hypothetical protein
MSMPQRGSGAAASRGGTVVAVACLLLTGCTAAERAGGAQPPAATAAIDWLNTSYTVTCDGVVAGGFRAAIVDGSARVPADASRPPYYEHYDISITATASGDVDGDGATDAVVLLDCSPQPSNGIVQEVQLFASTGRPLGTLPSPRTLREDVHLPPVYDPAGLSVQDGVIVAAMHAYGPEDFHASGPSVPLTVRWHFDGREFVRTLP